MAMDAITKQRRVGQLGCRSMAAHAKKHSMVAAEPIIVQEEPTRASSKRSSKVSYDGWK